MERGESFFVLNERAKGPGLSSHLCTEQPKRTLQTKSIYTISNSFRNSEVKQNMPLTLILRSFSPYKEASKGVGHYEQLDKKFTTMSNCLERRGSVEREQEGVERQLLGDGDGVLCLFWLADASLEFFLDLVDHLKEGFFHRRTVIVNPLAIDVERTFMAVFKLRAFEG